MAEPTLRELIAAANAALAEPRRGRRLGAAGARFELYHCALSIGSQQVRVTLLEKGAPFDGHELDTAPPNAEHYHPDYVRLRLYGARGRDPVSDYTGRAAAAAGGFDPAAVPTLVDREEDRVLVDSVAICEHIDRRWRDGSELLPARLQRDVDREIAVVDAIPHAAVCDGAHPDGDFRPEALRRDAAGAHDYRIMKLMEGRSLAVGHPRLIAAYDAKIRAEAAARRYRRSPERIGDAASAIVRIVAELDGRLGDGREWVCGEVFTLADVIWATSLYRLKWLGMGFSWQGGHALNDAARPAVAAYAKRLFERPGFRAAVIDWPGMPRSEYVAEHYPDAAAAPGDRARGGSPPLAGHGRDVREENLTDAVLATMRHARDPRARQILTALTRHLHAFLEEVRPTEAEWQWGIDFLTRTGHLSTGGRQEFILLSDVIGATARVDLINNRFSGGATENSVLGPFYVEPRPSFDNGADISAGVKGRALFFNARVLDTDGRPVAGARVDVWHADGGGGYDVMMDGVDAAMRGLFRADAQGRVWFLSVLPESYPIPDDGTAGRLLRAADRNIMRPAHVHVRIEAPGFRRLTTMLFVDGDRYLDADPVFGVKQSLVVPFVEKTGVRAPDGRAVPSPAFCVDYDFVLARAT